MHIIERIHRNLGLRQETHAPIGFGSSHTDHATHFRVTTRVGHEIRIREMDTQTITVRHLHSKDTISQATFTAPSDDDLTTMVIDHVTKILTRIARTGGEDWRNLATHLENIRLGRFIDPLAETFTTDDLDRLARLVMSRERMLVESEGGEA